MGHLRGDQICWGKLRKVNGREGESQTNERSWTISRSSILDSVRYHLLQPGLARERNRCYLASLSGSPVRLWPDRDSGEFSPGGQGSASRFLAPCRLRERRVAGKRLAPLWFIRVD